VAIEKVYIEKFIELAKDHPVIDVRSPGEYNHAHIPGAYNLPLFTDEERKIVGTTYKQTSREAAIKIGLDFFGPNMKNMLGTVEEMNSKILLIHCWRGGMRSAAIAWLMDMYGFKVYTLIGGYKKFRNYVLDAFKLPFQFKILGGYTGSGKTEVLQALKEKGESIIDLEFLAKHKGSAFGDIGMPKQPSQEMFENILAQELRQLTVSSWQLDHDQTANCDPDSNREKTANCIWIEDESQRIGYVNVPVDLWKTMRRSPVYFLDIPFEKRLEHLAEEYGCLDKQKMIDAISRIKERLGNLNAKTAIQLLEEGNTIESFRILLKYYDKYYLKALHNRENLNSLLYSVESNSVSRENAIKLLNQFQYQAEAS
jgi:tRNA 2-selenouridine synthase